MPLLTDVDGMRAWAEGKHDGGAGLIGALGDRYPLVIFHGDIGTGKTATAEAAADALARLLDVEGHLLKLSTRVRGVGHVGEMSTLISEALYEALALAGKSRFVTLIIDERRGRLQSRGGARTSRRPSWRQHDHPEGRRRASLARTVAGRPLHKPLPRPRPSGRP
jgi:hypothetical protein